MDYQGYKLIDKIMLICKDKAEHEESGDYCRSNHYKNIYQAYLVDPSNKNQLKAAQRWAEWTEYGPSHKNAETGKWEREYEIPHKPVEFEFENNGFELELLDCAGGSSQGGKLSFWNCIVTKDNNSFVIGINSDMLLDLLKNASFEKGKCQSSLIFITQKGKVGMTVEGSETYKQCIKDKELMSTFKKTQTSKFTFGDKVSTATINEVYLGPITKYYEFDIGQNNRYRRNVCYSYCTLRKLAKPVTHYLFDWYPKEDLALSDILKDYENSVYSYPDIKKSCPKRTITGKINLDYSEEDFRQKVMSKVYNFDEFFDYAKKGYSCEPRDYLYYFLCKSGFGFGFEPFELDAKLMEKIKAAGIKYIEE